MQHTFHSVEEYMYNYLVEYYALFALFYVFRKISFFYSECGNWSSVEILRIRFRRGEFSIFILDYVSILKDLL